MFPIKYIENNLVFNHDGECFAYYELTPYNYSFLSPEASNSHLVVHTPQPMRRLVSTTLTPQPRQRDASFLTCSSVNVQRVSRRPCRPCR